MAEVISISTLRARRDAKRADTFATIGVIDGEIRPGDVVLVVMEDGSYGLDCVKGKASDGTWYVHSNRYAGVSGVVGRVVTTRVHAESAGAS